MTVQLSRFVEDPAPACATCEGKERFETPQMAHSVLEARKATRSGREAYRCPHCGYFHLGRRG